VIISKASTELQISDEMPIQGGGYKIWVDEVTGFNKDDPNNGYAGVLGKPITSLRVSGDKQYRIHRKAAADWLSPVTGNDQFDYTNGYAGSLNGENIDGIIITGNVSYAVHVIGEGWLPAVKGDNINDFDNYAGIFGKSIDAIMIENRIYATSYYSDGKTSINNTSNNASSNTSNVDNTCSAKGGTCMNPTSCSGTVLSEVSGLCQGGVNKCCIPNNNATNSNSGTLNPLYIIIIVLSVILFILIVLSVYFILSKKWIKRSITSTLKNLPSVNNNNNNVNNNINNNNELPPSYYDVVNEDPQDDIIIYSRSSASNSTSAPVKMDSTNHGLVKVIPNKNSLKNHLFSIIDGTHNYEKGSNPTVERGQAVMINLDEPLESSSSIKKEKSVEKSEKGMLKFEEAHEVSSSTNTATFTPVGRTKTVMINLDEPLEPSSNEKGVKSMNSLPLDYNINEPTTKDTTKQINY